MPTGTDRTLRPRGSVLVVEDEPIVAMDLETLLRRHGWRVLGPAGSVAEALRLLAAGERPDLALLDANLRGELAGPVAEALRARGVPFLLTSAYDPPGALSPSLLGARNLGKPTDPRRLLAALEALAPAPQG